MCLINIKPSGKSWRDNIFLNAIHRGFETQRDLSGFGFYQASSGKLFIDKPYATAVDMIYSLKEMSIKDEDVLVIHHRLATDGEVNTINCHPIPIKMKDNNTNPDTFFTGECTVPVLFHNGIISKYTTSKKYSDSYLFAQDMLTKDGIIENIYKNPTLFSKQNQSLFSWSKFAMLKPGLSPVEPLVLFGEDFLVDEGYLFSNSQYKTRAKIFSLNSTTTNEEVVKDTTKDIKTLTFTTTLPEEYYKKLEEYTKNKTAANTVKNTKSYDAVVVSNTLNCDNVSDLFVDHHNKEMFEILCCIDSTVTNPNRAKGKTFKIDSISHIGTLQASRETYNTDTNQWIVLKDTFYMASLWSNSNHSSQPLYELRVNYKWKSWYEKVINLINLYPTLSKNCKKRIIKFLDNADNHKNHLNIPNYGNFEYKQINEAVSQINWLRDKQNNQYGYSLVDVYNKHVTFSTKNNDNEELDAIFGPAGSFHKMFD